MASPVTKARRNRRKKLSGMARSVAIIAVVGAFVTPLVWMILASLKRNVDIYDADKTIIFEPTLSNYETVFGQHDFLPFMFNSFLVAAAATGISIIIGVPAAYAMSRFLMRKSSGFILLARVIPAVCLLVPWYYVFAILGLTGTYYALILTHIFVSLPLIIWIMLSFFDGLPTELEESGMVDGLTGLGAFARIALPLAMPGLATATILSFIFSWNNFIFALVLSNNETRTLPVAIFNFISYASIDWGGLMAASVVITIPVVLVALFTQRYIVSGMTAGATKG